MSIKRTIITTVLALALVAVVAPVSASALTAGCSLSNLSVCSLTDLVTLRDQLTAQLGTPAQTPGNCTGVTFARTLVIGSTGSDVKCLQTILNLSPTTQVAIIGAGSPGSETAYFGSLTLSAVRKYQVQHGWTPANQVGPSTRAALNASLVGGVIVPPIVTTALCPNGNTVASSCTLAPNAQATVALCPNGNTIASNCSLAPSAQAATVGLTGFIDAGTLAPAPANNANITATTNVPVLGVNVKAINSDMVVNSLKVQLTTTKVGTGAEHPATSVQNLYVYDGSTLLGSYPVNTNTVYKTSGGLYYVILSGFSFRVPANTTKALTISADFAPALETNRTLAINLFDGTAVGAIDGTGATRTSGTDAARSYTVKYETVGNSTLAVTASSDTPVSTSVKVDTINGVTGVPMLTFKAKSTVGASKITDLIFTVTGSTNEALDGVSSIELFDGANSLGTSGVTVVAGATTGTASFTDLAINIAKDATKVLTVKADIAAGALSLTTVSVDIAATATDVTYQTPDLSDAHPAAGSALGNDMHLFAGKAAVFSLLSPQTNTYQSNATDATLSSANGTIAFNVLADGADLTKLTAAKITVNAYRGTDDSLIGAADTKSVSIAAPFATTAVTDGSTATVTVKASEYASSYTGYVYFRITHIFWTIAGIAEVDQSWGLGDYVTPSVNLQ